MPECLQPYAPRFKGAMNVKIVEDADGNITLSGLPPNSFCNMHSKTDPNGRPKVQQFVEFNVLIIVND